jgi:hypothetical protein
VEGYHSGSNTAEQQEIRAVEGQERCNHQKDTEYVLSDIQGVSKALSHSFVTPTGPPKHPASS